MGNDGKKRLNFILISHWTVRAKEPNQISCFGSEGREIYETMQFKTPPHERTLQQVAAAFDRYCNPQRNETVERYRFFSRIQEINEDKRAIRTVCYRFIKVLAATCNFGDLKESLVRDRIICGIRDKQLREKLLKKQNLDLERCLNACRAAELSKERRKALGESEVINSLRHKPDKRKWNQSTEGRMNHFAEKCFSKSSRVNTVASESSSSYNDRFDDDEYCLTINSDIEYETINNYTINVDENAQKSKKLFATFDLKGKSVKFQMDSGATCNVISVDALPVSKRNLKATRKVLKMYNNDIASL